jgi:phosphoserine phosphatase
MKLAGVFLDLDGTLIRKKTVCEIIADEIGMSARMQELEAGHSMQTVVEARQEIISWYKDVPFSRLEDCLTSAKVGPGVIDLCQYCVDNTIPFAIVSMTWSFAVEHFADIFGTKHFLGTEIFIETQKINHVFPQTKLEYVNNFITKHGLDPSKCCAIGDSWGDYPMIESVGLGLMIGKKNRADLPQGCIEVDARKNLLTEVLNLVKDRPATSAVGS